MGIQRGLAIHDMNCQEDYKTPCNWRGWPGLCVTTKPVVLAPLTHLDQCEQERRFRAVFSYLAKSAGLCFLILDTFSLKYFLGRLSKYNNTQHATFTMFNNCIVWRLLAILLMKHLTLGMLSKTGKELGDKYSHHCWHILTIIEMINKTLYFGGGKWKMFFLIIFSYDLHGFSKAMYTLTMYSLLHCLESTAVRLVLLLTSGVFLFFFLATLQDFSSSTRAWAWATTVKSGMLTTRPPGNSLEIFNSVLSFSSLSHSHPHVCIRHFSL